MFNKLPSSVLQKGYFSLCVKTVPFSKQNLQAAVHRSGVQTNFFTGAGGEKLQMILIL